MKTCVLVLALSVLTGCATSPLAGGGADPRVRGDAESVSVEGGRLDALPLAVLHCARYRRSAQFSHADGDRSVFRCVGEAQ